jgi:hypothetical protein
VPVALFRRRLLFVFRSSEALGFFAAGCAFLSVISAFAVSAYCLRNQGVNW